MNLKTLLTLTLMMGMTFNATAKLETVDTLDISINTPQGFTKSTTFAGFVQMESFASIKMIEVNQALEQTLADFFQNTQSVISRSETTISDREGLLVKSLKTLNGNEFEQWTLIFGDRISSITITANYPRHLAKGLSPAIKTALLSTRWLRLPSQQIFQGLPFVLDASDNLQIVKRTANSVVLMDKAPYDSKKAVTPLLVVSAATSETELTDIETFSKQQLNSNQLEDKKTVLSEQETKINGIRSYEMVVQTTDKKTGLPVTVYQVIAFQPHRYLLVQGMVENTQADQFMGTFKQIVASLKFKKVK